MLKKIIKVNPDTHKKLMLRKINCKAKDLNQVIADLLKQEEKLKGENEER